MKYLYLPHTLLDRFTLDELRAAAQELGDNLGVGPVEVVIEVSFPTFALATPSGEDS